MGLRKSKTIWLIRTTVRFRASRRRGIRIDFVQAKRRLHERVLTYKYRVSYTHLLTVSLPIQS